MIKKKISKVGARHEAAKDSQDTEEENKEVEKPHC